MTVGLRLTAKRFNAQRFTILIVIISHIEMEQYRNNPASYFARKLSEINAQGLESVSGTNGPQPALFSDERINDKVQSTGQSLHRIIRDYLNDSSELHEIANRIENEGFAAIEAVRNDDNESLIKNDHVSLLETIVCTDGTRPTFLVRNGVVDLNSAIGGIWNGYLQANEDKVKLALACVGRIDLSGKHIGTGFLVEKNLILTNRHVMQAIADYTAVDEWQIKSGAVIDFGFEYRARKTVTPRQITDVVFCGDTTIERADHNLLDVALLRVEPIPESQLPFEMLSVDVSTEWAEPASETMIYTIGYPANPGVTGLIQYGSALEKLFHSTYGYKRLAPGKVINSTVIESDWSAAHDATTLGGNSGSLIVRIGREVSVSGLHYGGKADPPRENWGHITGKTLKAIGYPKGKDFRTIMEELGVKFTDNF